jgi:hypothetical protein
VYPWVFFIASLPIYVATLLPDYILLYNMSSYSFAFVATVYICTTYLACLSTELTVYGNSTHLPILYFIASVAIVELH